MLLASASKEASQEQNVFYLSISSWSGPAFNSTVCQYFFERQIHPPNSGCRGNRLNTTASTLQLQGRYCLYITCTNKVFLLWANFHHQEDKNRPLKPNADRPRGRLSLPKSLCWFNPGKHTSGQPQLQALFAVWRDSSTSPLLQKANLLFRRKCPKKTPSNLHINRWNWDFWILFQPMR